MISLLHVNNGHFALNILALHRILFNSDYEFLIKKLKFKSYIQNCYADYQQSSTLTKLNLLKCPKYKIFIEFQGNIISNISKGKYWYLN